MSFSISSILNLNINEKKIVEYDDTSEESDSEEMFTENLIGKYFLQCYV